MSKETGFLYSQIGYDRQDPKKALVRSGDAAYLSENAVLILVNPETFAELHRVPLGYWGEKWGSHWWTADFTGWQEEGAVILRFCQEDRVLFQSKPVSIADHILWESTVRPVAFDQLRERRNRARNGGGFKDCGHHWREVASHTPLIIGLTDLLEVNFPQMTEAEAAELKEEIIHGCDYLAVAQDTAKSLGLGDGALVHEFPSVLHVIPGNIAQAAVAFARAGRLLIETHPAKALEYLDRAKKAFRYFREDLEPWPQGFHPGNHGAPEDYQIDGSSWMTRDLLMVLWAAFELWQAGGAVYQRIASELARQILSRQIQQDEADEEGGFWGHFRTFDRSPFTEKANVHHHWGHDTGAVFPHYLYPLCMMTRLWGYHPDVPVWRKALENFVNGYLVPACKTNPFGILPMGYFRGEGMLTFSGPWHGWNVTYGFAAALAQHLQFTVGGEGLREIAVANLQWVAGLNCGVTADSFSSCLKWKEEVPQGEAWPVSMIQGVGERTARAWTDIPGTIMNGFSNNPQFQHLNKPAASTDGPWHFTDEDWIPHSGGWLAGIAWVRELHFFVYK